MYKATKFSFLIAILVSISSVLSASTVSNDNPGIPDQNDGKEVLASVSPVNHGLPVCSLKKIMPKTMFNCVAVHNAPGQIAATWTSDENAFTVYLLNITTSTFVTFQTNNFSMIFPGLNVGHTYIVSVHDSATVKGSGPVLVKH